MIPWIEKMFFAKAQNNKQLFTTIEKISELSNKVNKQTKEMDEEEYHLIIEQKNDYYISLADFLKLIDKKDLSVRDISANCTHITELTNKVSVVEMYSIIEDGHIVLCADARKCDKHKAYAGDKLRIVSIKRVSS